MRKSKFEKFINSNTDPYEALAIAIIVQAADDYRETLCRLSLKPDDIDAKHIKKEVEIFFRSDWFKFLSGSDGGNSIIRQLKSEVKEM